VEAFQYHVYICDQKKPEGVPGCAAAGSGKVIEAMRREVGRQGLGDKVQITTCGSLGLCEWGPNMVVYPEGVWYCGVMPEDVPQIVREHFGEGTVVARLAKDDVNALRAEIDKNKARMMAAMKARDEAGVLPDDLLQMIRGFQESRIILTALELDLFSAIGKGATAVEAAGKIKADARAVEKLLDALVALELLTKIKERFFNSQNSARYFMEDSPDSCRLAQIHTANLWQRWSTLTECVRQGTSVTYTEMAERGDAWTAPFIAAMHKNSLARAPQVVRAVGAEKINRMLDIGGGSAGYSIAFAKANPHLTGVVFDLPAVVSIARANIEQAGLANRLSVQPGDMRTDDFGRGFDLVLLSAICHMNGPQQNIELLEKSGKALIPGGRIVIQDFILNEDKTSPRTAALFAINMLVGTLNGSTYAESEYGDWLRQAGFTSIERLRLPGPTGLLVAFKP